MSEDESEVSTGNKSGYFSGNIMNFQRCSRKSSGSSEIEKTSLLKEDQSVNSYLTEIAAETAKDKVLQSITHYVTEGWIANKRHISPDVVPFLNVKDELSVSDGIIYRNDRIVVPKVLRKTLTNK